MEEKFTTTRILFFFSLQLMFFFYLALNSERKKLLWLIIEQQLGKTLEGDDTWLTKLQRLIRGSQLVEARDLIFLIKELQPEFTP